MEALGIQVCVQLFSLSMFSGGQGSRAREISADVIWGKNYEMGEEK
jgi:hypothetical protein